jgi:mono/diheme cytochrome c family protein
MKGIVRGLAWGGLLLATLPSGINAQAPAPDLQRIDRGRRAFSIHCQTCHGPEARGDGPMAEILKVPVPDLTLFVARREGTFPDEEVHRIIDGRTLIEAHGSRRMPIWGLTFQEAGRAADQETEVYERIRDLTAYLGSIQRSSP